MLMEAVYAGDWSCEGKMYIHIALFRWKPGVEPEEIKRALREVESLKDKVPGVVDISTGRNSSRYSAGYTHVVLVRAESQEAIDAYRQHPDHVNVAQKIDAMEEHGIGVDLMTNT
ncbi:MAG TPA: stress protein [Candidatus Andersenbacteria bacterium]|nr:MAG: hypothetical protein UW94_C0005G0057 [Parcubacteria group bacterium GW2011_GWA2_45_14]HBE90602.1 stress protein [Candidatus Andersenbacteria bacterium]